MQKDWGNLKAVLYLVRHGSLAAAADKLGVNYTTVARRIALAEASYGARFFNRLPHGYQATEAGQRAADHAEQMEQAELALRLTLGQSDRTLSGKMAVTAPQLLIAAHLCEVFDRYLTAHPQVDLTVLASNDLLNLNRREADLAVRISDNPGDTLIGRRLARQESAAFATPEVAAGIAAAPDRPVDWIGFTHWQAPPRATDALSPTGRIKLRFDDMTAVVGAARAGLGVARLPVFLGRSSGGLVQVPGIAPQPYPDIWAVAHRDLWQSAKVTALRTMLAEYFATRAGAFVAGD